MRDTGFEPVTPSVSGRCSTTELTAQKIRGRNYAMHPRPWQAHAPPLDSEVDEAIAHEELISRSDEVPNFEMPFASLREFVTPNESFYVRCHFPIPEIRAENWH